MYEEQDICANKHGGNEESVDAWERSRRCHLTQRMGVLELLAVKPMTMKEIAALWKIQFNKVSGRATELKKMGMIRKTGERRGGAAVLELIKSKELLAP